jgi:hypothetical protein
MSSVNPSIQLLETVGCFREVDVWRRVVLAYLADKKPAVHALLVGSQADRDQEILTNFPSAEESGHQGAIGAARASAAVTRTEDEAITCLLLFLGPGLQSQAITHKKGSVFWDELFEQHEQWKEAQVPVLLGSLRGLGPKESKSMAAFAPGWRNCPAGWKAWGARRALSRSYMTC